MNLEESLYLLDKLLLNKRGKELAIAEQQILQAAWQNIAYVKIAEDLYLTEGYIKDMAYRLWKQLSEILIFKVNKSNFRQIMENHNFDSINKITISQQNIGEITEIAEEDINNEHKSKEIILLVDDVQENLRFLNNILQRQGYDVRCTPNASMALKVVQSVTPNVILLDIRMPNIDGYQLCEILKQNEKLADVPIIFLSALHDVDDKIRAFEVGGVDYITKPFQPEEVLLRVRSQIMLQSQKKQLLEEIMQHQQTVEALYKSSVLLASLLNNLPDGILEIQCVRDDINNSIKDFSVVLVNPTFVEIFAQNQDDFQVGKKIISLLAKISGQLPNLLIQTVETGKNINQVLPSNLSVNNQQELHFIIMKLGDGCSIVVRNIISNAYSTKQLARAI